jgi:tetratricopeptide (TPR) repeat protein
MRRRGLLVILLLAGLGGSAALGWYAWRRYTAPVPPKIAHEELDPELAEAIEKARQKIHADPYSAENWGELGKLLRASQLLPEASDCFAQAEKLDPQNPRWPYLQGEALRMFDQEVAVAPLQRAAALADTSDTIAPSLRLAEVLLTLGRNDEAEAHLRRVVDVEPDNPTVHYNLGVLALERGDLSTSLTHLQRCEHSPFTRRKACIQLAAVYQRMGKNEETKKYSGKADTLPMDGNWLDPFLVEVVAVGRPARFQQVHQMELRKDYRGAAELLTSMLQEQPEYRAYVALGEDLVKLGDFDRAEQALRAAIALVPEEFRAYHQLSRLLLMRANNDARGNNQRARPEFEEAAACARKAIAHRPDHAMPHVVLGMALRQLGKREKALQAFRAAVEREPNLTDAHFYLGETLAEAGQLDAARVSLQRAAELSPDDPRPKTALAKLTKNQH